MYENVHVCEKLRKVIKLSCGVRCQFSFEVTKRHRSSIHSFFMVTYSLQCSAFQYERWSQPSGVKNVSFGLYARAFCISFISSINFHLRLIESIQINRTGGTDVIVKISFHSLLTVWCQNLRDWPSRIFSFLHSNTAWTWSKLIRVDVCFCRWIVAIVNYFYKITSTIHVCTITNNIVTHSF